MKHNKGDESIKTVEYVNGQISLGNTSRERPTRLWRSTRNEYGSAETRR